MKNVYLGIYNLFQFIGFAYVLTVMYIRFYKSGAGSYEHIFFLIF
jgi:hypothetical protein